MANDTPLRAKQRAAVMRRVQLVALDLFCSDGFDAVSTEQIAAKAETSPATIYRHFGTKERIVIWDEADESFATTIMAEFAVHPFATALEHIAQKLDRFDARARRATLQRLDLIAREPSLKAQADVNAAEFARGVAAALAARDGRSSPLLSHAVAGHAAAGVLSASISEWARQRGRTALAQIVTGGLKDLRAILAEASMAKLSRQPRHARCP